MLLVDNSAVALLPKRTEQRIVLVGEGNLFLRKVLEVNPLVKLETVDRDCRRHTSRASFTSFIAQVPETMPAGQLFR